MSRSRLGPRWRALGVCVALGLFAAGSNNCLLAALSGRGMACLAVGGAGGSSHCCHARGGAKQPRVPSQTSPCCVTLAPAAKVSLDKLDRPVAFAAFQAQDEPGLAPPRLSLAPLPDEGPPLSGVPLRALHERAPPRA